MPLPEVLSMETDPEIVVTGIGDATRGRVEVEVLKGVVLLLTACKTKTEFKRIRNLCSRRLGTKPVDHKIAIFNKQNG